MIGDGQVVAMLLDVCLFVCCWVVTRELWVVVGLLFTSPRQKKAHPQASMICVRPLFSVIESAWWKISIFKSNSTPLLNKLQNVS